MCSEELLRFLISSFSETKCMIFEFRIPIDIIQFVEFMEFDMHRAKVKFWLKTIFMHHIAHTSMEILSKMHNYHSVSSIDLQSCN